MQRANWIPSVLLVFALPFILATVQGETNRLTIVIVGLVLTPIIGLQAWSQNVALRHLEAAVGSRVPTEAMQTIADMARLIFSVCFAATVVDVCVLLGIRGGVIPEVASGRPGFWLNVGLVVASVAILTGPMRRVLHVVVAASPVALLALGATGRIDVVPVAAWGTLFGLVCAVILGSIQNKAMFEISADLARAGATLREPPATPAAEAPDATRAGLEGRAGAPLEGEVASGFEPATRLGAR